MSVEMPHISNRKSSQPPAGLNHGVSCRLLGLALALGFAAGAFSTADAQITTIQNNNRGQLTSPMTIPPEMGPNRTFQERRIRQLNVERQKELVSDTNKLVKLVAQLNAEVARSHSNTLTLEQERMLARIEKLARSVKDKMSNPVQGTILQDNFPPPMTPPAIP